jgi:glucose/arabinose dehydrogenase
VDGLEAPVGITGARDGSDRLFVNERAGKVRVVNAGGALRAEPFVDLTSHILAGGERGLLGLAFHPDFATNRRLFVDYTRVGDGATVISELTASPDGQRADPASERILLLIPQPYANHNGGQLAFGPDGDLYIGMGDGGGGDPQGNGQNPNALLGKILRIDVDAARGEGLAYAIPADNPYASAGSDPDGGRPEVWAIGLRNPWRFSFDAATGDLFIGDVGQGAWEEIDRQPANAGGPLNYGWNVMEGDHCFDSSACDQSGLTRPIAEYSHEFGCAVAGGYVYRGSMQPALHGVYVYGDYCSGLLFTLQVGADGSFTTRTVARTGLGISSLGVDDAGELFVADLAGGALYRVLPGE